MSTTVLKVTLSASDLQSQGTGSLIVSNPDPGSSSSSVVPITVTVQPVIQSVTINPLPIGLGSCYQLQVTITGVNFRPDSTIQVNGISLPPVINRNLSRLTNVLPSNFVTAPGALTFTVSNSSQSGATSDPFPYPASDPPLLTICASPSPTTVFPGSSFAVTVQLK